VNLKILLPSKIFAQMSGVDRIVAEARGGSFGLRPHRLDCVAALVPGILSYSLPGADYAYVALDEGVLIKTGSQVLIAVRRAIAGSDLARLRTAVSDEFRAVDARREAVRIALATMDSSFMGRVVEYQRER
jgi:F-type H+-transporting ATPase subunit epsilon